MNDKESCAILIFSTDMEWRNAFLKGAQRFYLVNEHHVQNLDSFTREVKNAQFDVIIVGVNSEITVEKAKCALNEAEVNIPIIAVDSKPEGLDNLIKQGAEYAVARRDLLSALKYIQQLMKFIELQKANNDIKKNAEAIAARYERIYNDLPDPVAYVQDGLFLDANPAFVNLFGVEKHRLDEYTLMNFVPNKSERALKAFLKKASGKDVIPAEKIEFQKLDGEPIEVILSLSNVIIDGESALQMHFRSGNASGGGSAIDETTKLPGRNVLLSSIKQNQEKAGSGDVLGYWVYLQVENYREVWQRDGFKAAEILIKEVANTTKRLLPPSTEVVRFTDDALALWLTGDKESVIQRIKALIARLDEVIPENIGRMINPVTYAGMFEITQSTSSDELISKGFRAVRGLLSSSQNTERVSEPLSGNMSRKDERKVHQINNILEEKRIKVLYQPISSLEADGIPRYSDKITFIAKEDENPDDLEVDSVMQIAERYDLAKQFDYFRISTLTSDVLSYGGDQKALNFYIKLSNSALNDEKFAEWMKAQLKQTGVAASQIVFEFTIDAFNNAFSGAMHLVEAMRPEGSKFALTEIARYDDEIVDMLKRLKPEVLKLDMREIDTFEDEEEERFMKQIKDYADENKCQIVVNHMESPAQLSRVWRYDIQLLQGDGIVPPMEKFSFNFSEPLF